MWELFLSLTHWHHFRLNHTPYRSTRIRAHARTTIYVASWLSIAETASSKPSSIKIVGVLPKSLILWQHTLVNSQFTVNVSNQSEMRLIYHIICVYTRQGATLLLSLLEILYTLQMFLHWCFLPRSGQFSAGLDTLTTRNESYDHSLLVSLGLWMHAWMLTSASKCLLIVGHAPWQHTMAVPQPPLLHMRPRARQAAVQLENMMRRRIPPAIQPMIPKTEHGLAARSASCDAGWSWAPLTPCKTTPDKNTISSTRETSTPTQSSSLVLGMWQIRHVRYVQIYRRSMTAYAWIHPHPDNAYIMSGIDWRQRNLLIINKRCNAEWASVW